MLFSQRNIPLCCGRTGELILNLHKYYCQMPGPGAELVGVWCFVNNARGFPRLTFEYAESHIGSLL